MSDRQTGKLLIVDDNSANLIMLGTLLNEEGYQVQTVASGVEALQFLETVPVDLVLMDIRMPDIDGYEICQRMKQLAAIAHIPVIFISAADNVKDKVRGFEVGGIDFITKPFEGQEILARVRTHLQIYRLQKELESKIADLERAYQTIRELSIRDELTQLHNRRHFNEQAQQLLSIAKRYGQPISFAICDIDRFKLVNDRFSHTIGDEVLTVVAHLIRDNLRAADFAARYGGEEFAIVFPQTKLDAAAMACNKIRLAIEKYDWHVIEPHLSVTISIGIATRPDLDDYEPILSAADEKLYEAKQNGRNRICY